MKVHITENVDKIIGGFNMLPIIYGKVNMGDIPNNSLTEIMAVDAIDKIGHNELDKFLVDLCSKMRMGCKSIFGGLELSLLARNVVNNRISSQEFNNIVLETKGIHKVNDVVNLLKSKNLKIENVIIKGNHYEITAVRPAAPNQL